MTHDTLWGNLPDGIYRSAAAQSEEHKAAHEAAFELARQESKK